jgi:drug/metabolite transporter (DMT)-like permease
MKKDHHYYLLLHLIVLLWGFTGILGKLIHLDCMQIVWHRLWIAIIGLSVFSLIFKASLRIFSFSKLMMLFGIGIIIALHWITFFKAIQLSTASLGILCLATTTFHVAWLEPIVLKRKISWVELALSVGVVLGIGIVSSDFKANDF